MRSKMLAVVVSASALAVTAAPAALVASSVSGPGTLNVGGVVSLAVTVTLTANVAAPVFPWPSVALHVTVVCPTAKLLPEGGLHVAVSVPSTASVAETGSHVTTAVPEPSSWALIGVGLAALGMAARRRRQSV